MLSLTLNKSSFSSSWDRGSVLSSISQADFLIQSFLSLSLQICKVRVIKDYIPNAYDTEALPLVEDEIISVVEQSEGGWWRGINSQRKKGVFPHTYVEELPPSNRNSKSSQNSDLSKNVSLTSSPSFLRPS